jgi:hypothetical protein
MLQLRLACDVAHAKAQFRENSLEFLFQKKELKCFVLLLTNQLDGDARALAHSPHLLTSTK